VMASMTAVTAAVNAIRSFDLMVMAPFHKGGCSRCPKSLSTEGSDLALTDRRMQRYPVYRDATRGHEESVIRVRDDHHLNRRVNGCECLCGQNWNSSSNKVPVQ